MNPPATPLMRILEALRSHRGRANAISAPNLELVLNIPERTIRRELEEAFDEGILEELEIPAVGLPGVGFFLAEDAEDFQAAYDAVYRLRKSIDRKLGNIRKLATSLGLHLHPKPQPARS